MTRPKPSNVAEYTPPPEPARGAMRLHCNEGAQPPVAVDQIGDVAKLSRQYPNLADLRRELADRVGRPEDEVLVTAGADGVIDRVMRAFAGPGRSVVVPDPTFEMIPTYALQTGATVVRVPWDDGFPVDQFLDAAAGAAVVALVTPDNPTGRTIDWSVVRCIASSLPDAVILLDHAYVEYADEDYTAAARAWPNIVVARTLSKAWGLAGLRVGYAVSSPTLIDQLSAASSPYPVSAVSASIALQCLRDPDYVGAHVERVRVERQQLAETIRRLGGNPTSSRANFVFARFDRPTFVRDALGALDIEVRSLTDRPGLTDALRVGCPGDEDEFARLEAALTTVLRPEALIFDMDGVIADVRASYREAIVQTCREFDVEVSAADIAAEKRRPESNDDFVVTQRLLRERGMHVSLEIVSQQFQRRYDDGLWRRETLLLDRTLLGALRERFRLAIVTGRPRTDAQRFIESQELGSFFDAVVCREDAELKPSPAPVKLALRMLDCETGWMFGDTVDDIAAARSADVLPIGVAAPDEMNAETRDSLAAAGAAATFGNIEEVLKWLI